jgi:hypothetical protein
MVALPERTPLLGHMGTCDAAEVAVLFSVLAVPWWLTGGCAIEMAVGHVLRDHADIDVLLLRRDQRRRSACWRDGSGGRPTRPGCCVRGNRGDAAGRCARYLVPAGRRLTITNPVAGRIP